MHYGEAFFSCKSCFISVGQDRLKLWHICQAILTSSESTVAAAFFREITLTKNATFAKIKSVLNIFHDFSREFDRFHDFFVEKR